MHTPPTNFTVHAGGDPFQQLFQQVAEAAQGVYDVLGEIGRGKGGSIVYLAREVETAHLLALKLKRTTGGAEGEFDLTVVRTLDESVPGLENSCPECKQVLPDWERFCFHCGADLSQASPAPSDQEANALLAAVKEATAGQYDVVGKMTRADGGGLVFFARDLARNKLVALRLKREAGTGDEQAYSIGETQVLRPMAEELVSTQLFTPGLAEAGKAVPRHESPVTPALPPLDPDVTPVQPSGGARRSLYVVVAVAALVAAVVLTSDKDEIAAVTPAVPIPQVPPATTDSVAPQAPVVTPPASLVAVVDSGVFAPSGLPAGARLLVDARVVRRWPVRLPAGVHQLVLSAPGYDTLRTSVSVSPNDTLRWRPALTLVAAPAVPSAAPVPDPPATAPSPRATCARSVARSDWTAAAGLCRDEADAGKAEAQRLYAGLLEEGHGTTKDLAGAAMWYSKAATAGDRDAQLRLGFMYRAGTGVRKDERQAVEWFRKAAEGGSAVAMMEYAVMLDGGRGVSRNDAEAAEWFRKASDAGSAVATRRLGRLYERGEGVPKSESEAARLYGEAATKGDAEAQYQLGRYYKDGKGGLPKSASDAVDWFRKAAAQDHPAARDELRKLAGS